VEKEIRKSFRHGYYEVSNLGIAYRVKPGQATYPGKTLEAAPNKDGYLSVSTSYHCKKKTYYIHLLVARKFLGPCPPGKEVHHRDHNKQNNRWDNLKYVTSSQNKQYAIEAGVFHASLNKAA